MRHVCELQIVMTSCAAHGLRMCQSHECASHVPRDNKDKPEKTVQEDSHTKNKEVLKTHSPDHVQTQQSNFVTHHPE